MAEHSPLPWTVVHDEFGGYDCMWPAFVVGPITLDCGRREVAHEFAQANAEFIARACNSYGAMLDALKALEWSGQDGLWSVCPACGAFAPTVEEVEEAEHIRHDAGCQLAAAIAKAEGRA